MIYFGFLDRPTWTRYFKFLCLCWNVFIYRSVRIYFQWGI